ncbi:hypothetical protein GJAV_G00022740 [Gymnothorax javanicus]|nr:hypothetical protein GJAV_G00022740 [Gymnothorax javanicus]
MELRVATILLLLVALAAAHERYYIKKAVKVPQYHAVKGHVAQAPGEPGPPGEPAQGSLGIEVDLVQEESQGRVDLRVPGGCLALLAALDLQAFLLLVNLGHTDRQEHRGREVNQVQRDIQVFLERQVPKVRGGTAYLVHQVNKVLWAQWVLLAQLVNLVLENQGRQACLVNLGNQVHLAEMGLLDRWVQRGPTGLREHLENQVALVMENQVYLDRKEREE